MEADEFIHGLLYDEDNSLSHYGVLGMQWGKRNTPTKDSKSKNSKKKV